MHVWTETPVSSIWSHLRYFESAGNVGRVLSGTVKSRRSQPWADDPAMNCRSRAVASCIRQANEYFAASRTVGLATRPLLQFYGVECLAKAAILCSEPSTVLTDIKYHGLGTRPAAKALRDYADDPANWAVEDEFAIINEGVFPRLALAMGDQAPVPGAVIRLNELARMLPEAAPLYEIHYGRSAHCFPLYEQAPTSGPFAVYFDPGPPDRLVEVFPELLIEFDAHTEGRTSGFQRRDGSSKEPSFLRIIRHTIAGDYIVRPHSAGFHKPATTLFGISFILSNLVRYKPEFWLRVIEGSAVGSVAMVERLSEIIERRFAQEVLESIWQEAFSFGSLGYLT